MDGQSQLVIALLKMGYEKVCSSFRSIILLNLL